MPSGFHDGFEEEFPYGDSDSAYGCPTGLSVWAVGLKPSRPPGSKGPMKGVTIRPPSITVNRERKPGTRGPLPARHQFLDVARYRFKPYKKKKKPIPMGWDRLKGFREVLWFLVLAGYSPTFLRDFFFLELRNLFPQLSIKGVTSSVETVQKLAQGGKLILDSEFADTLEDYKAGPWAHNAPDWLRAQYGVELVNSGSGGKDSGKGPGGKNLKGGGRAAGPAGEVVPGTGEVSGSGADGLAGGRTFEDFQKETQFFEAWGKYSQVVPGTPPLSAEEVALGVRQGVAAVLASRQSKPVALEPLESGVSREPVSAPGLLVPESGSVVPGSGLSSEDRVGLLFEEVSSLESYLGRPLNLTGAEVKDALVIGLPAVLARRAFGPAGSVVSVPGSPDGPGSPVVLPVSGSPVSPVPVEEKAEVVPAGDQAGKVPVAKPVEKPVEKPAEKPVVPEVPVEVVPPVSVPAPQAADVTPAVGVASNEEAKPAAEVVPKAEVAPVSEAKPLVDSPFPKPSEYKRPAPVDPVPSDMEVSPDGETVVLKKKKYPPEMLRYAGYVAPAYSGSVADLPADANVLTLNPVPEVWVLEDKERIGREVSKFVEDLGPAAPYLVDSYSAEKYGDWVLEDAHGLGVRKYFLGKDWKRQADVDRPLFELEFPELKSAPKDWWGFDNFTISQARDCFEEWRAITDPRCARPTDELIDLVERGMGPAYWNLGPRFLLQWMLGLAFGEAMGMGHRPAYQGFHRHIPFAAVMTPELARELRYSGFPESVLWRPLHPLFLETLAPRNEAENLPGYRWVTGMGYMKEELVAQCLEVLDVMNPDSHRMFKGLLRMDGLPIMINWAKDVARRVKSRFWIPDDYVFQGEKLSGFFDLWRPSLCESYLKTGGFSRHPASCLLISDYGLRSLAYMTPHEWFDPSFFWGHKEAGQLWDFLPGGQHLFSQLRRLPVKVHAFSLMAVTYYLSYLEKSFPRVSSPNGKVFAHGYRLPESFRLSDEEILPKLWGDVAEPASSHLGALKNEKVRGAGRVIRAAAAYEAANAESGEGAGGD